MMNTIPWPLFLQPGKLRDLSTDFTEKTGCVLLLRNVELPYADPTPTTYRQAFVGSVIGLYAIYYDYAGKFIDFFLNQSAMWEQHKKNVCQILRSTLAHGRLHVSEDTRFISNFTNFYAPSDFSLKQDDASLDDLLKQLNDPNDTVWQHAQKTLVDEADQVFTELQQRAQKEQWRRKTRDLELRKTFCKNRNFFSTFDQKACATLVQELKKKREKKAQFEKDFSQQRINEWQPKLQDWYCFAKWNCKGEDLMEELKNIIENDEKFLEKYNINVAPPQSSLQSADRFFTTKKR